MDNEAKDREVEALSGAVVEQAVAAALAYISKELGGQSQTVNEMRLVLAKAIVDRLDKTGLDDLLDYVDEALWDKQFETVPEALIQMGHEAAIAYQAGRTQPLDLDRL